MTVTEAPAEVPATAHFVLPDSPHKMWVRGELADFLKIPDGFRVEIVGGEIEVSPGPVFDHSLIVEDVHKALTGAESGDEAYPWRRFRGVDLNLVPLSDGYIPDLVVVHRGIVESLRGKPASYLTPDRLGLVVEVTSKSTAANDRPPVEGRKRNTKWNGYAATGVPYHLLVDRSPRVARIALYSKPTKFLGRYEEEQSWSFGDRVDLPSPFEFGFDTSEWTTWSG